MTVRSALKASEGARFLFVFALGFGLAFVALASANLPWHLPFDVLAWPVALMQWLFPAPCFDRGPGERPFCEGTPIQIVTWGFGFVVLLVFYWVVAWFLLRSYVRDTSASR